MGLNQKNGYYSYISGICYQNCECLNNMKGKLIKDPNFYPENPMPYSLLREKEYLILGIENRNYYIYNELHQVDLVPCERIEITDKNYPNFWQTDNSATNRLVPKEWHWENFLNFDGEPYCELWDYEIWSVTQFAKGLELYNLPVFPERFIKAYDAHHKIKLIENCLKIAGDYDSLKQGDLQYIYRFSSYGKETQKILEDSKNTILTNSLLGFEVLNSILQAVGEPLQRLIGAELYELEEVRKRILFSIWALFGTKEFYVLKQEQLDSEINYLLTRNDESYVLSFDYVT